MYRLTNTLDASSIKRSHPEKLIAPAFEAVIRMVHDNTQLGREIRRIHSWDGVKHLTIRYGDNFVTLEKL